MNPLKSKKTLLTSSCLSLFLLTFFATSAFADTFNFKWSIMSGNLVSVAANGDNLNSDWGGTVFTNARTKWNGTSARILVSSSSFSSSKLDLYSVSSTQWTNNGWGSGLYAWAQPWSGGSACSANANANPDTKCTTADYGAIYINSGNTPASSDLKSAILAHEIGHIVGLAHTTSNTSSLMQGSPNSYFSYTPTTYDVNQFNGKY
ncbi:reprolysin-like metallopeptidase [Paenibacillus vandeheii]